MLLSTAWPPAVKEKVSILKIYRRLMLARLTLLEDHGHGTTLVQNTQLALGSLLVGGVGEDASVQKRPVRICNHGSDVT